MKWSTSRISSSSIWSDASIRKHRSPAVVRLKVRFFFTIRQLKTNFHKRNQFSIYFELVCVEQCPRDSFVYHENTCNNANFEDVKAKLICLLDVNRNAIQTCEHITALVQDEKCARWYLPSKSCKSRLQCAPFLFLNFWGIYIVFL